MGSFNTSGSFGAHWHGDVDAWVNSQNAFANQSSIHVRLIMRGDTGYSVNASTGYVVYVNGGAINSGSRNIVLNGGSTTLIEGDVTVNHDANGNWSGTVGGSLNCGYSGVGSGNGDYGFSVGRLALGPSISSITADQLKPTSARLGTELSSYGHGTSATARFYYRIVGSGTWLNTEDQGDVTGFNYFALSGLKPGTSYEYFARWFNNNGDSTDSGTANFKTQSVPGMIPVLLGLI